MAFLLLGADSAGWVGRILDKENFNDDELDRRQDTVNRETDSGEVSSLATLEIYH